MFWQLFAAILAVPNVFDEARMPRDIIGMIYHYLTTRCCRPIQHLSRDRKVRIYIRRYGDGRLYNPQIRNNKLFPASIILNGEQLNGSEVTIYKCRIGYLFSRIIYIAPIGVVQYIYIEDMDGSCSPWSCINAIELCIMGQWKMELPKYRYRQDFAAFKNDIRSKYKEYDAYFTKYRWKVPAEDIDEAVFMICNIARNNIAAIASLEYCRMTTEDNFATFNGWLSDLD